MIKASVLTITNRLSLSFTIGISRRHLEPREISEH